MKSSIGIIHRFAAISALLLIMTFFTSTVIVELFASNAAILLVKTYILYGIAIMVPMMAVAGITGAKMAPKVKKGPIASKKKRMPFIALNGLVILLPSAIYLQHLASIGQFDSTFYIFQTIELLAGFCNICLMLLNVRDGRKITRPVLSK